MNWWVAATFFSAKLFSFSPNSVPPEGNDEIVLLRKSKYVSAARDRGVSYAQASQDLNVHPTQLRNWVKAFADDPQQAFPGQGQMKPEQCADFRTFHQRVSVLPRHAPTYPYDHK
jgi:hypothetical protein